MNDINYFSGLCFFWALIGIISRFFIISLGERWNKWEVTRAYSKDKPLWVYVVGVFGIILVGYTWYMVFTAGVNYSWIIAVLISLTLIKIFNLLFNYQMFREFVTDILNDKKRLTRLNAGVFIFSVILIILGIFVY